MTKVLVTGAAGFLGFHLCKDLLRSGLYVTGIDNLSSATITNIKTLNKSASFKFIKCDIKDEHIIQEHINNKYDYIYNLACPASPPFYQSDPIGTLLTCSQGVKNILDIAREHGSRILQASTSEVYGDPLVNPQQESYYGNVNCFGPRSCYDEGKRYAEALMYTYKHKYDCDIRIVRIFNSYGPNMRIDDGRVITNFICQALEGSDITVYGDGSQTRSFCYCKDTIEGLQAVMNHKFTGPVNIGNPNETTIKEVAEYICKATNSKSKIIYRQLPTDDPKVRRPDISKVSCETGWKPSVELETGLKLTIDYISKNL